MTNYRKKLLWLYARKRGSGSGGINVSVSGTTPLTLADALAHGIKVLIQYGKVTQSTTPTPDLPVDIVCNNGAVRYGALGDNLFNPNPSAITLGWYIASNNGQVLESQTNYMMEQYIPIEGDKKYVFYGRHKTSNRISSYNRIAWYSASKTYMSTATYPKDGVGGGTAPLNARYARLSCNLGGESASTGAPVTYEQIADYNWTFAQADAEIPYEPFVGGIKADGTPEVLTVSGTDHTQTASVQNLFAVGDVSDEQNIIGGHVTRKVGVKMLTGEDIVNFNNGCFFVNIDAKKGGKGVMLSTHFTYSSGTSAAIAVGEMGVASGTSKSTFYKVDGLTSKAEAQDWVDGQYANGTPVIVLYPLAEETAETVTGQSLSTAQGTNTVSVTSEVGEVELAVTYKGGNS